MHVVLTVDAILRRVDAASPLSRQLEELIRGVEYVESRECYGKQDLARLFQRFRKLIGSLLEPPPSGPKGPTAKDLTAGFLSRVTPEQLVKVCAAIGSITTSATHPAREPFISLDPVRSDTDYEEFKQFARRPDSLSLSNANARHEDTNSAAERTRLREEFKAQQFAWITYHDLQPTPEDSRRIFTSLPFEFHDPPAITVAVAILIQHCFVREGEDYQSYLTFERKMERRLQFRPSPHEAAWSEVWETFDRAASKVTAKRAWELLANTKNEPIAIPFTPEEKALVAWSKIAKASSHGVRSSTRLTALGLAIRGVEFLRGSSIAAIQLATAP